MTAGFRTDVCGGVICKCVWSRAPGSANLPAVEEPTREAWPRGKAQVFGCGDSLLPGTGPARVTREVWDRFNLRYGK